MPYVKRRGRKRRYRKKKKVVTLSRRQARTKKYDSVLERVAARVARLEIKKTKVLLTKRVYWFGQYAMNQNLFSNSMAIGWGGQITELSNIQKTDIEIIANAPQGDNALSLMVNENLDQDGVGQGQITKLMDGRRSSDKVRCSSISVGIRVDVEGIPHEDVPEIYDGVWLHYGVYSLRHPNNAIPGEAGWPQPAELMPLPRFGYEPTLDAQDANDTATFKKRTIIRGKVFMPYRKDRCQVKFVSKHKKWTELLQYDPLEQNGQNCLKSKLFLVVRSDVANHLDHNDYRPSIIAYTKLRYYDV